MLLEFTKLEYHIIFFNRTNSNSAVPRWQNRWGTRVSEIRVLEKVVLCHLFPKQCFFTKNFQKMWYLAILAKICSIRKIGQNTTIRLGLDLAFAFYVCVFSFFFFLFFFFIYFFFQEPVLLTIQLWTVHLCTVHGPTNITFQSLFH